MSAIEIELRYKVLDVPECVQNLAAQNIKVKRTEHLIDEWYLPNTIKSLDEEKDWFDKQHGIAWRIRRADKSGGKQLLQVESKQLTADNNHNSFNETQAEFDNYDAAVRAMNDRAYRNWLTIDKTRYFLTSANPDISNDQFELVLDEIKGLKDKIGIGACLEIEFKGAGDRDTALHAITAAAAVLGFTTTDLFEQSLTVVSMTELARF